MSDYGEMVGNMVGGITSLISGLFIAVIFCSATFGFGGYLIGNNHGKKVGYEQGAKDALAGKISWQQTIKQDSVLIIKK